MNENVNSPAKWLQYLLYVGIAALVNTILINIPLVSVLAPWSSIAISAATIFLLFRLANFNEHYQTSAVLYTVSLIITVLGALGITVLGLVGSICGMVGQYQEYHAHGEMIEEQDPKLAGKWGGLFWLQFAVSIIVTLLSSVIAAVLVAGSDMDMMVATSIVTIVVALVTLLMKALYLSYLNRTIKLLDNEIVVE